MKCSIIHCTYLGVSGYNFKKNIILFCLKIFFALTNSVDPLCSISSGSLLFVELPERFPKYKGLSKIFDGKTVIFSLLIYQFKHVFWVLIETVLLSTNNIYFGCEIRKIVFN